MELVTALVLGSILLLVLSIKQKSFKYPRGRVNKPRAKMTVESLSRAEIETKWAEIEAMMKLGRPSNFKVAVIEADKLLSRALEIRGYHGPLGDQLKESGSEFSDLDGVWFAHKVRNRMVHEVKHETMGSESKEAIIKFERALKDLGVLR